MILRTLRRFLAIALAGTLIHALPANADDYTDIWWSGPAQDGWGVNFIQSQDFIFATFFVYGPAPAKTPIWYVGNLTRQPNGSFMGGLYQTTGTGIGAPWNSADHTAPQVGTATFTPIDMTSGTLVYNVGAIIVTKSIVRQTLTSIALAGNYSGTDLVTLSGCTDSTKNGTTLYDIDTQVTQTVGGPLRFDFVYIAPPSVTCTMTGVAVQEGQLFRVPSATYKCVVTNGINTTATMSGIKATALGIEGQWTANIGGGCKEDGRFSGLLH